MNFKQKMIIIRFRISLFVVFLEKEAFYEEKYCLI